MVALSLASFTSTVGSVTRNLGDRASDIFNVKDFGAKGDGINDDTSSIQAAINSAAIAGISGGSGAAKNGGIVFFPPGSYKVSSPLKNNIGGDVQLHGSGEYATTVFGTISNGFIIDTNAFVAMGATLGQIDVIQDMQVQNLQPGSNTGVDISYGSIRFNVPGGRMSNVIFGGTNGIIAVPYSFNSVLINCTGSGPGGGSVSGQLGFGSIGIAIAQGSLIGCVASAYGTAMCISNVGATLLGTRTESSNVGVDLGFDPTGIATSVTGATINSHTTERCMTGYKVTNASDCQIIGSFASVPLNGPVRGISGTPTWSAGTLTINSSVPLGWSGTKTIVLENFTSSGPGNCNGTFTATFISSTSFSVPLASNPGTITIVGDWSTLGNYGIQFINPNVMSLSGCAFSGNYDIAGIDMSGTTGGANVSFISVNSASTGGGPSWVFHTNVWQSIYTYSNCNNPSSSFTFANLPGQAGVMASAIEGMEFNITNGPNSPSWGSNVTSGSGSTHMKVRYNGTNWTAVGI